MFVRTPLCVELSPRDELVLNIHVCQRSNYHSSQSVKTLKKDIFELILPTVLDLKHTTPSLSANQITVFARAVGLEVNLASYGLLEVLVVRSRAISGLRGPPARSPFASASGSTCGDIVASQSLHSLPILTGSTVTSCSEGGIDLRQMSVNKPSATQFVSDAEVRGHGGFPLAVLVQQANSGRGRGRRELLIRANYIKK